MLCDYIHINHSVLFILVLQQISSNIRSFCQSTRLNFYLQWNSIGEHIQQLSWRFLLHKGPILKGLGLLVKLETQSISKLPVAQQKSKCSMNVDFSGFELVLGKAFIICYEPEKIIRTGSKSLWRTRFLSTGTIPTELSRLEEILVICLSKNPCSVRL